MEKPEQETTEQPGQPKQEQPTGAAITVDAIAEAIAEAKPEAQAHFVEAMKEKTETEADQKTAKETDWRFLKDSQGRYWSAEYCEIKADPKTGLPPKTARGLWVLKRSAKAADRKKLPKRPPNIEAREENREAAAAAEVQQSAEAEAAAIAQQSILAVKAILAGHAAIMSTVASSEAVEKVMGHKIGEGKFQVRVSDMIEASGVDMMIKRGGAPQLSPEIMFLGGLAASSAAIIYAEPKRRQTIKEKMGLAWSRIRNRKKTKQPKQEQRQEQPKQEQPKREGVFL